MRIKIDRVFLVAWNSLLAMKARGPFPMGGPDLIRLMSEIETDYANQFEKVDTVGTLVHFRRLD